MRGKRDGLIRRRGIYGFRHTDKLGNWVEKSCGTADRAEAVKFKKQFLEDLENDESPTEKAEWPTVRACALWVQQRARIIADKWHRNEKSYLNQLTKRIGPERLLKDVNLDTLKDYQSARLKEVGARPINCELTILIRTLEEANLWKGGMKKHYKRLSEPESEVGTQLTVDELVRLEAMAATREEWTVAANAELLCANSGMRGGEVKKLRLGHIDLEHRRLQIVKGKSKKASRLIELNPAAFNAVVKLFVRATALGACDPEHYLLPSDLSRHVKKTDPLRGRRGFDPTDHQVSWDTAWRKLRTAAGLPGLRFHVLRHTFISQCAENNVPMAVTRSMVGHVSDAMTTRYTHITDNAARAAVEKIGRLRPGFVDIFVDIPTDVVKSVPKLLN